MSKTIWQTTNRLPENEPNTDNANDYAQSQLLAGASDDGRYVYDVVYLIEQKCFVLTMMDINAEWGFIEHEKRLHLLTRAALLQSIALFQAAPQRVFENHEQS
ncbi:MAG: hypothetical protein Q4B82_00635 [Alysiella sp.]|uniref:hypothetical protein n=1 Tax=Alysiella sp. TaxID=1872483 RepID=UPI0026DB52F8|nr:hypothetical protein [Alysiella sp.]MDO4433073.1 hypothetical protein [Alysiella sp.]